MMGHVRLTASNFGLFESKPVQLWHLEAATVIGPIEIAVAEYGATLQSCVVPDALGNKTDIVLGHDTLSEYMAGSTYFGAIAGRYGNRLRNSLIQIDGSTYDLIPNEGSHQLHGGPVGFDKRIWAGGATADGKGLLFRLTSPDGDMGFPGCLEVEVEFRITEIGGLNIDLRATTDKTTVCNPVHHTYWNLGGHASGSVRSHVAQFNANFYTPVDGNLLTTGEILSVAGTPFDFRTPKPIGKDLDAVAGDSGRAAYEGGGYDHNLVLGLPDPDGLRDCVKVFCPDNGLGMRLRTTEPGVQFYTGGYLSPDVIGKGCHPYDVAGGFTLETQKFPCSPEFSHFETPILRPDEAYEHRMQFEFFTGE